MHLTVSIVANGMGYIALKTILALIRRTIFVPTIQIPRSNMPTNNQRSLTMPITFYRVQGFSECFSRLEDATAFARNMGLEGRITMRVYRVAA